MFGPLLGPQMLVTSDTCLNYLEVFTAFINGEHTINKL